MTGQIKNPVQSVPQRIPEIVPAFQEMWEADCFWLWKGALQVVSKTRNSLIFSAFSSKIFSQGSYLDVSSLILFPAYCSDIELT